MTNQKLKISPQENDHFAIEFHNAHYDVNFYLRSNIKFYKHTK